MLNRNEFDQKQENVKIEQTMKANVQKVQHKLLSSKVKILWFILFRLKKKRLFQSLSKIEQILVNKTKEKVSLIQSSIRIINIYSNDNYYYAFDKIKEYSLNQKSQQIKNFGIKMLKIKQSAIKFISIFFRTKQKSCLRQSFNKILLSSKQNYLLKRQKYRAGFRKLISIQNRKLKVYFSILIHKFFRTKNRDKVLFKLQKLIYQHIRRRQNLALIKIRHFSFLKKQLSTQKYSNRQQSHFRQNKNQQLEGIKQKQQLLQKSIAQVKKQKQSYDISYRIEIVQAEKQEKQINSKIQIMKVQKQNLQQKINTLITKLLQYDISIDQIYEMCYNNVLLFFIKNRDKQTIKKQDLLNTLTKPLLPKSTCNYQKMIQQNKSMKQLLSVYQQIYGTKNVQRQYSQQIPFYELNSQNQLMYSMLKAILTKKNQEQNSQQLKQVRQKLYLIEKKLIEIKNNN